VVVILMGVAGAGTTTIGAALAQDLGWLHVAAADPHELHVIVARTLGRREHLVVTSRWLAASEQEAVRGELHGVRFVDLAQQSRSDTDIVHAIRYEFGL
jgi:hypothetical protein